ncbi:hypothetical protein HDF16_005886 [Granulicella aggregans]|uniref:Uncharacterized protein n=1 Tax=Granulicella aggregans TaxID=474949 RepID=A0A7W7ZJN7_9BACT|nr:hypothetical protein [Granulicella aggregans]MBB5061150.1 hypothetical protein [Granulicella aggregans]
MQFRQSLRFASGGNSLRPGEFGIHKLPPYAVIGEHAIVILQMNLRFWSIHVRECALHL